MAIFKSQVVPKNSGAAFEVRRGQRLRVAGKSIVDFVAFNLYDLNERFDQARTKTNQVKIFLSTGDVLYSKCNNPMLTIVEDSFKEGRHDLQKGMCSRKRFEMVAQGTTKRMSISMRRWIASLRSAPARNREGGRRFVWKSTKNSAGKFVITVSETQLPVYSPASISSTKSLHQPRRLP